jgi:hypothetical protein
MALIAVALLLLMWNYIIHKKEARSDGLTPLTPSIPMNYGRKASLEAKP